MIFHAGDLVQIRSKQEILATLDKSGRLEGLPFMPQMFKYCGKSFKIFKVAHKTCDTVNGTGGRWLPGGIHLDLRCDGQAYGGCQAACLIFWKEAWLKPVSDATAVAEPMPAPQSPTVTPMNGCLESDVLRATSVISDGEEAYQCQAVRLPYFTRLLPWWRPDQYIADYLSGNVNLRKIFNGLIYTVYTKGTRAYHPSLGRPGRWFYNWFQTRRGGTPYPRQRGRLPAGEVAPVVAETDGCDSTRQGPGQPAVATQAPGQQAGEHAHAATGGFEALAVPNLLPAVVFAPTESGPHPLIVAAHGAGGMPEWECEYWRRLTEGRAFLLCLRGERTNNLHPSGYYYRTHVALEASSHGIDQRRLDGVSLCAAGFTNLTQDHLDYHATMDAYRTAKLRLFEQLLPRGRTAVLNADSDGYNAFAAMSILSGLSVMAVGERGRGLALTGRDLTVDGQILYLEHQGRTYDVKLPLAGLFQASNALVAAGLAIAAGEEAGAVIAALGRLKGARGRLERVGARLDGIASATIRVLHDRRIPGTRANIDHLVVTPGGIWVVDSKRYKGRPELRVEGGFLRPRVEKLVVGGRDKTKLVEGVEWPVEQVRSAAGAIPVTGVLCFVEADWPLIGREEELGFIAEVLGRPDASGVVLVGEAGVGKTRLATETIRLGKAAGFATERVVASRAASSIPFGALAPLLPSGVTAMAQGLNALRQATIALTEIWAKEHCQIAGAKSAGPGCPQRLAQSRPISLSCIRCKNDWPSHRLFRQ